MLYVTCCMLHTIYHIFYITFIYYLDIPYTIIKYICTSFRGTSWDLGASCLPGARIPENRCFWPTGLLGAREDRFGLLRGRRGVRKRLRGIERIVLTSQKWQKVSWKPDFIENVENVFGSVNTILNVGSDPSKKRMNHRMFIPLPWLHRKVSSGWRQERFWLASGSLWGDLCVHLRSLLEG